MTLTLLIISSLVGAAFSQMPNGLNFGISNEEKPRQAVVVPYIVNEQACSCVISGSCTSNANGIDIRIVNTGSSSGTACPAGWVWCCSNANPPTPVPPADRTCGVRRINPQVQPVVGQASFGAYPWQAALLNLQQDYVGSGVLLDSSHVLTAAHRVASFVNAPTTMLVRLGEWNIQSTSEPNNYQQFAVAKITIHPSFNPSNLENDVAVIRLNGIVSISNFPNINTACKPSAQPVAGSRCYVSGWGKNLFGPNGSYQSIVREVDVPILDGIDCENRLKETRLGAAFVLNKNSFLCAGGESGKDACTGDGGSPLVCPNTNGQWVVVGIVAWGIGCATPNVPGVYTNVYNFLPWINQVIATQ